MRVHYIFARCLVVGVFLMATQIISYGQVPYFDSISSVNVSFFGRG